MPYFEGKFVMISSPTEARAIEYGLQLAIEAERRNGTHVPPMWVLELIGALHKLWADVKVAESQTAAPNGPSGMIDVVKASEILGKTPQATTADCRAGRLDGFLVRGRWQISAASVEALAAEMEHKSA
jgi:hypothetical protein